MNTHLPIFGSLIDTSQFLDFVLHKEGGKLIVIDVRNYFECEKCQSTPATSASVLENPVTFLPAKMDFPLIRAPTRALDSNAPMSHTETWVIIE